MTDLLASRVVCSAYPGGCTFFNSAGLFGVFFENVAINTFIKNSSVQVTFDDGYMHAQGSHSGCSAYVGWDLPVDIAISHCDADPKCDGVIGRHSHGRPQ